MDDKKEKIGGKGVDAKSVSAMSMERNQMLEDHLRGDYSLDDSPSYEVLNSHDMLCKNYRVIHEDRLIMQPSNATRRNNAMLNLFCCPLACFGILQTFQVPNACVKLGDDGRGNYIFFGPGVHRIVDPWYTVAPENVKFAAGSIIHGDRTIVTVPQGFVGYCTERGQPVLLPPGMHNWRSSVSWKESYPVRHATKRIDSHSVFFFPSLKVLQFEKLIDLNDSVITVGPWTLLTIDQGYMAVTQDNGKQMILEGGHVYLLTHRNWKFERFVSTKIQTNELKRIEAASADNVVMVVDATVLWRIGDVETAVRMSAETMNSEGSKAGKSDIMKLRNDVLKQAEASLAFFIGTINFSDTMAAAAIHQRRQDHTSLPPVEAQVLGSSSVDHTDTTIAETKVFNLYNNDKLSDAVAHANKNTEKYGVEILAINIVSAIPKDKALQASLAAGAVAAAEAQMMETTAQGKGRAIEIEAAAKAKQTMILAKAEADADILRAEGAKKAADLLLTNPVAVDLAKIERTGNAIAGKGNHATFFFGSDPTHLSALLSNNGIVSRPAF
jgi:regulator of protease activity HflC (stomatin/prohibitin superfamily)